MRIEDIDSSPTVVNEMLDFIIKQVIKNKLYNELALILKGFKHQVKYLDSSVLNRISDESLLINHLEISEMKEVSDQARFVLKEQLVKIIKLNPNTLIHLNIEDFGGDADLGESILHCL